MTGPGFSMANLEKGTSPAAQGGSAGVRPSGHSRRAKMLIAALIFALLGVQLVVGLRALPNPLWAIAGIAIGLPLTVLVLRKPEFGLLMTVAFIPLESLASRQNDPLSLFKVFGGLALVAFLVGWAFQGRYPGLVHVRQNRIILVLGAVLIVSAIFTRSPELTRTALRRYATLFIFYFLVVNLVRTRRLVQATAWLIMVPVAISSGVAVASYLLGQNLFPSDTGDHAMLRTVGTSRDANFFAATILVGLPFYVYFFKIQTKKMARVFLAGCFLVNVLAVVYSFSRGGAIAMALMMVIIAAGQRLKLRPGPVIATVAGLVILGAVLVPLVPSEYGDRLASFRNWQKDDSLARRTLYIVFGAEIIAHRPITGCGPGAFQYVMDTEYQRRFPARLRSEGARNRGRAAHNMYLEIAAELGIPGILAFGWLFYFTLLELRRLVRAAQQRGPPEFLAITRSVEVAYWGFLITSLFLSAEYRKYLWLLIAMTAVLRALEKSPAGYGSERPRSFRETLPTAARSAT